MRLGQLARKLALPPSEITAYLAAQQVPVSEGVNTRLDDNHITVVLQRFAPGTSLQALSAEPVETYPPAPIEEEIAEKKIEFTTDEPAAELPTPEPIEEPIIKQEIIADTESSPGEVTQTTDDKIETIKAQKVALSGLKVLGKIDLPEKKKKTEAETQDTTAVTDADGTANATPTENQETPQPTQPKFERRNQYPSRRDRRDQRPAKNPISLAREREQRAAEEKRKEEAEKKKQQRTENYQKRVKVAPPTKAAKLHKEEFDELTNLDLRPAPKTWMGKFWRWFRS